MAEETQKPKLHDLKGNLSQNFHVPFSFKGEEYTISGTYEHETNEVWKRKDLKIAIPDIRVPPYGNMGLYVEFTNINGHYSARVRDGNVYFHRPEVRKFFEESVQAILQANLPTYMKKLIRFDTIK